METVYNVEVEEDHTYFVGEESWLFSLWTHNLTCKEIGEIAEKGARGALVARGHKIVGSIKNASGHGIDLITRKGGKLFSWEVKGSTIGGYKLSSAQAGGAATFTVDRLRRVAGWNVNPAVQAKAIILLDEIRRNGIRGGIIHIPNVFSGSGSTIRFLPWR